MNWVYGMIVAALAAAVLTGVMESMPITSIWATMAHIAAIAVGLLLGWKVAHRHHVLFGRSKDVASPPETVDRHTRDA